MGDVEPGAYAPCAAYMQDFRLHSNTSETSVTILSSTLIFHNYYFRPCGSLRKLSQLFSILCEVLLHWVSGVRCSMWGLHSDSPILYRLPAAVYKSFTDLNRMVNSRPMKLDEFRSGWIRMNEEGGGEMKIEFKIWPSR